MLNKLLKIIVIAFTLFSFNFSARSDDTIKIAMIEPMSGPLAAIGLDLIEQMEFFAEKVNKEFSLIFLLEMSYYLGIYPSLENIDFDFFNIKYPFLLNI